MLSHDRAFVDQVRVLGKESDRVRIRDERDELIVFDVEFDAAFFLFVPYTANLTVRESPFSFDCFENRV